MTEDSQFQFTLTNCQGEQEDIPLRIGDTVFVLGANGSGKSALIHRLASETRKALTKARKAILGI